MVSIQLLMLKLLSISFSDLLYYQIVITQSNSGNNHKAIHSHTTNWFLIIIAQLPVKGIQLIPGNATVHNSIGTLKYHSFINSLCHTCPLCTINELHTLIYFLTVIAPNYIVVYAILSSITYSHFFKCSE